jgi:hypothetical protein
MGGRGWGHETCTRESRNANVSSVTKPVDITADTGMDVRIILKGVVK